MGAPTVISQLTDRYARLLGEHKAIEKLAENAVGLEAIEAAHLEIAQQQRKLAAQMAELRGAILQFDPKFNIKSIRPIRPKNQKFKNGSVSRVIYAILRDSDRPLTTRQIGKLVAAKLKLPLTEDTLFGFDKLVRNDLFPRIGTTIEVSPEPQRWSLIPRERVRSKNAKTDSDAE